MQIPAELYDKKIDCPICKDEFHTKRVRASRLRLIHRDEDFLSHYNLENPIKYNVVVCPNCGYAAYNDEFENIGKNKIPLILKNISSRWKKRSFGNVRDLDEAIETYKLALINYNVLGKTNLELANILLHIAWLYRLKEEEHEEELRFIYLAKEKFINAYESDSLAATNMNDSKLSYLIGELSRRLSNREEALKWFNICLNLPETKMDPNINNLVREQWRLAKDIESIESK